MTHSPNRTDASNAEPGTLPRVFIADPSPVVIGRLIALIDDVAEVAGRATNARDAIRDIARAKPHLAVLDAGMPDGIELLKQVKTHQPPVVAAVLTHSAEETTRQVCLRLGADYFLDKIHEFETVREIIIAFGSGWGRGTFN